MKKINYKALLLMLMLAFASCSFTTKKFSGPDKDKLLIQIIMFVINEGHFDPIDIDDKFSEELFSDYIELLDPAKRYFYSSDYKEFAKYKFSIDDQLKDIDITFFNVVHDRFIERINEVKVLYKDVLSKPFDFTIHEDYDTDNEISLFVKNKKEMKERWRKQLKFSTLSKYDDLVKDEERAKKNDSTHVKKTEKDMEIEARESTLKSINLYFEDYMDDQKREDWFAMYVNTIVEEFDPHTYYLAPKRKEDFDQRMSGKLEGIGARLQKRMDYIKVVELISGGPAWRAQELEVEDVILKVKQEDEDYPVNIVGMRISDAIRYIKGPKGTKVTLTVKKIDGSIKDIVITRDVVELYDTYAKSSLVTKDQEKYGVIDLPSFYADFKDYKNINAANDVKKEIERLKADNIKGIILDLRNNGGGSLSTVIDMAGLFIKDGPVVQVRSAEKAKEVLKDKDKSITWEGPLIILVNEISASASEIMAAAMQDYKRAIIIGGDQTYGKGTVQNVIDLNNMMRNNTNGDLGALALTRQKYYRINGGSVQLEGVKSDIKVPGRYTFIKVGEKDTENPLPYDEIDPATYSLWNSPFDYEKAIANSKKRIKDSEQIKFIEENAKWVKSKVDETVFSLNYKEYKKRLETNELQSKKFDAIADYQTTLEFKSHSFDDALIHKDTTDLKEKRKRWHDNLSKDVYIEEAINILSELRNNIINKEVSIGNK